MSAEGVAFVYDYRPDRRDYTGYSAVTRSFTDPMKPHLDAMGVKWCEDSIPLDGWLNVRFYTWPQPQEHVFISHGIADKAYRTPSKLWGFQWIHTSGPWWTDYYKRLGPAGIKSKLFETGYTKLDPLFDGTIPRVPAAEDGRLRVLWAPTHAGINGHGRHYPSSYIELRKDIAQLLPASDFDVTVAPHPRLREQQRLPIKVTMEEYAAADVVVADAGSTLYEAWALGLPVVLPSWIVRQKVRQRNNRSLELDIYNAGLGVHCERPRDLAALVTHAATVGLGGREAELIEAVFPAKYHGESGRLTAEALAEIARGPVAPLTKSPFMWVVSPDGQSYEHVSDKAYTYVWKDKGYRPVRAAVPKVNPH